MKFSKYLFYDEANIPYVSLFFVVLTLLMGSIALIVHIPLVGLVVLSAFVGMSFARVLRWLWRAWVYTKNY